MVWVVLRRCRCVGGCVYVVLHPRRAQGIESILVASMCRYRTIILGGASRLKNCEAAGARRRPCRRESERGRQGPAMSKLQKMATRDYEI